MKKRILSLASLAALFLLLAGEAYAQTRGNPVDKLELLRAYPDVIVVNGNIHTMDSANRQVQAFALRNHRIVALGTTNEIRPLAGPKTEIIDAKGRLVLPGLVDGHTHPHVWAVEHWMGQEDYASKKYNIPEMRIVYAKGKEKVEVLRSLERVVKQRAQELGPGKWIWVTLFGGNNIVESREIVSSMFPQQGGATATISREYLDSLAPNNPLLVFASEIIGGDQHNTKAKEEMERVLGYEVSGLMARTGVPYDIMLRGRVDDIADMLKHEMLTCLVPQGVTTYGNHYYGSPTIMKAHRLLYERGELPARWAWWEGTLWATMGGGGGGPNETDYLKFFYRNLGDFRGIGNDYIWNAGVSNEAWEGGLNCTTAKKPATLSKDSHQVAMRDCTAQPTDYSKAEGYQQVKLALEYGLRIGFMHGYSDGTYDSLFRLIEGEMADGKLSLDQVRALRISTEHNPIIRPDQIQKMAKYNMMPAFNGYQIQGNIKGGGFLKTYGEKYMDWLAPNASLAKAGGHPVFNTDAHLFKDTPESKPMDWPPQWDGNIWGFIEFQVTRKMPHDGITYNRNEAMDRVTMMKAATIWGAEQLLNEKNIGSLEVGKLGDFVILNKDFFTIPEDQIHTIKTLLTSVGGKTVYKDSGF